MADTPNGRGVTEAQIQAAVRAAMSQPATGKPSVHDWIKSGWTIGAALIFVGTVLFNAGQFVARIERPRSVKVEVPDHIRQELAACRALALVVTGASRRRGGKE